MRYGHFLLLVLIPLGISCKKSAPPAETSQPAFEEESGADLTKLAADLRSNVGERRQGAVNNAVQYDADGEAIVPVLLEALKDTTAAPLGQTFNDKPTSTREAAVQGLVKLGAKGEKALADSGLKVLEAGLKDPKANVREHTASALGMAGPDAKPVAGAIAGLCSDKERDVRGAAYRALQKIKTIPSEPILKLLLDADPAIASDAAEALRWLKPKGSESVPFLIEALKRERGEKMTDDEVAYIRQAAAEALSGVGAGAESAVPALVEQLTKASVNDVERMLRNVEGNGNVTVSGSILALRRIGQPAIPAVLPLLKNGQAIVRYQAALVLSGVGRNNDTATAEVLAALAVERGLPSGQMYVFEELSQAAINLGADPTKALTPLIELLKLESDEVRGRAAQLLARFGRRAAPAVPQLIELLKNPDSKTQIAAIRALGSIGPAASTAVDELAKRVTPEATTMSRESTIALKNLGKKGSSAVPVLAKALDSNDQNYCIEVAQALTAMGPDAASATDALVKHLTEGNVKNEERLAYLQALAAIGPQAKGAIPAVSKLLTDKDFQIRSTAVQTLGSIAGDQPEAIQKLTALLKDSFPAMRIASLQALARMGPAAKSAIPEIKAGWDKAGSDVKVWSAATLYALGEEKSNQAKFIREAFQNKALAGKTARLAAIDVLPSLGADSKSVVPELVELLKDKSTIGPRPESGTLRGRAAQTLGRLGTVAKEAIPALVDLLRDSDRNTRRAAIEALRQFGPDAVLAVPKLREIVDNDRALSDAATLALERIELAGQGE